MIVHGKTIRVLVNGLDISEHCMDLTVRAAPQSVVATHLVLRTMPQVNCEDGVWTFRYDRGAPAIIGRVIDREVGSLASADDLRDIIIRGDEPPEVDWSLVCRCGHGRVEHQNAALGPPIDGHCRACDADRSGVCREFSPAEQEVTQ